MPEAAAWVAIAANAPDCRVVLGELSEGALRVCKQNVRRNELNARVTCLSVNAMEPPASSLWDFDVIVSNPPYIPTGDIEGLDHSVKDYEPHMALDGGADGLDFYRFIAAKWKNAIRLGGSLIFEVGIGQAPDVENILAQNGFEQIQTTADTQGIWRVVEGLITDKPVPAGAGELGGPAADGRKGVIRYGNQKACGGERRSRLG